MFVYLFIACFDRKVSAFQQTLIMVSYILNIREQGVTKLSMWSVIH